MRSVIQRLAIVEAALVLCLSPLGAMGEPAFVAHDPGANVFGEPADVTQREPEIPREGESVQIWIKTGPSFTYDNVAVYYTTDGSTPGGSLGVGFGNTTVLRNIGPGPAITFVRNEPGVSGNDDWWVCDLPLSVRDYERTITYLVSAWDSNGGPPNEIFVTENSVPKQFTYTNLLAWPGSGSNTASPDEGYPPLHYWKEEAVVGNGNINVMLDQNGSYYDIYYPSAGTVQGVSTRNEGYYDGGKDQFPFSLTPDDKGQMHLRQAFVGIRPTDPDGTGLTYWLTNAMGTDFVDVSQSWDGDSNVVVTTQRLTANGNDLTVTQTDAAPRGIAFPTDMGGNPNKGVSVKRVAITNNGATPVELNVYLFADWQLNGSDAFDGAFADKTRGAMVAFDNTQRFTSATGEYNPTTFPDYEKNVSVYLAAAMKVNGGPAQGSWADTSPDQGHSWIGDKISVNPGQTKAFGVYIVGGFDGFAGATGTYDFQIAPAIDQLFSGASLGGLINTTRNSWQSWLATGVQFDCPDADYNALFKRSLLGTALHIDEQNGGIIAGFHNGAYPFVWPRDAAWAAVTLARTGFTDEAKNAMAFLRDIAYRDVEGWGRKGFWKQKYTTDGYTVWSNPQVDETSCYPWALRYIYDVEGDVTILEDHYDEVYEAAISSSQDSTFDANLRYEESVDLVYSMNLWEDSFDVFNYSNASVIRGLEDAAAIATILDQVVCPGGPGTCNYHNDAALFTSRAADIRAGLDARLEWNGENTDISQLGIVYPFEIYEPGSPRAETIIDRVNGLAPDNANQYQPLINYSGEWAGLINRYWGDSYWNNPALVPNPNGSPWFLSTLWYGAYYAKRQNVSTATADIDYHMSRINILIDELGPMGFGAEQIASNNTLLYPGQTDFRLQAAFPNAWESMSFLADAIMLFLDWTPDADANVFRVRPKLPAAWPYMEFSNIEMGDHTLAVYVERASDFAQQTFTNTTGDPVDFDTVLRIPPLKGVCSVTVNGAPTPFVLNLFFGTVDVQGSLDTGPGATTVVRVEYGGTPDLTTTGAGQGDPKYGIPDNNIDLADLLYYVNIWSADLGSTPGSAADYTTTGAGEGDPAFGQPDGVVDLADLLFYVNGWQTGCL